MKVKQKIKVEIVDSNDSNLPKVKLGETEDEVEIVDANDSNVPTVNTDVTSDIDVITVSTDTNTVKELLQAEIVFIVHAIFSIVPIVKGTK